MPIKVLHVHEASLPHGFRAAPTARPTAHKAGSGHGDGRSCHAVVCELVTHANVHGREVITYRERASAGKTALGEHRLIGAGVTDSLVDALENCK